MLNGFESHLTEQINSIRDQGLYKRERFLSTPQRAHIATSDGREVLNLCANNYLGLADHPEVIQAAREALDRWGFGLGFCPIYLWDAGDPQGTRGSAHSISRHR